MTFVDVPACAGTSSVLFRSLRDRAPAARARTLAIAARPNQLIPILYINIHRLAPNLSTPAPEMQNARGFPQARRATVLRSEERV